MRLRYLDRLADVLQTRPDGGQETVKPDHLLDEDGVHALLVERRVFPQRHLRVEVARQLGENVGGHFVDDIVRRLSARRRRLRLESFREMRLETGLERMSCNRIKLRRDVGNKLDNFRELDPNANCTSKTYVLLHRC